MQKLTHQLAGELGETLALAKFISVGLHAYVSPPGAPGHDLIVVTPEGPKSVEVKTRQYIDRTSEISRWPVDMNTKGDADYFLFIEVSLRSLSANFYLLDNVQAKAVHVEYGSGGNCVPSKVREIVTVNSFSALTGEPEEPLIMPETRPDPSRPKSKQATSGLRQTVTQEAEFGRDRIVQYACKSIDFFKDGALQGNAIENLRHVAKKIGVSEYNDAGGVRNTRQLGHAVIEAIKNRTERR